MSSAQLQSVWWGAGAREARVLQRDAVCAHVPTSRRAPEAKGPQQRRCWAVIGEDHHPLRPARWLR